MQSAAIEHTLMLRALCYRLVRFAEADTHVLLEKFIYF